VPKSTIETSAPVPASAARNARAASRTVSVAPEDWIERDSSRTSMTSIPQRGGRFGFATGAVTLMASRSTRWGLIVPWQSSSSQAEKAAS
jgi:hypothetical protein